MAIFTIGIAGSFVTGTAASDLFSFSEDAAGSTALGLGGDDTFNAGNITFVFLDGGAGDDVFNFANTIFSSVLGGDGNDNVFVGVGDQNLVSGGAGNDWIGIGGGNEFDNEYARRW